jgi:hypothetical protein
MVFVESEVDIGKTSLLQSLRRIGGNAPPKLTATGRCGDAPGTRSQRCSS